MYGEWFGNDVSFPRLKASQPKETSKHAQHFGPEPVPLPWPIGSTGNPWQPRMCFGFTWSLAPTWKHKTTESWQHCCGRPWMGMKVPWVGWGGALGNTTYRHMNPYDVWLSREGMMWLMCKCPNALSDVRTRLRSQSLVVTGASWEQPVPYRAAQAIEMCVEAMAADSLLRTWPARKSMGTRIMQVWYVYIFLHLRCGDADCPLLSFLSFVLSFFLAFFLSFFLSCFLSFFLACLLCLSFFFFFLSALQMWSASLWSMGPTFKRKMRMECHSAMSCRDLTRVVTPELAVSRLVV